MWLNSLENQLKYRLPWCKHKDNEKKDVTVKTSKLAKNGFVIIVLSVLVFFFADEKKVILLRGLIDVFRQEFGHALKDAD